MDIPTEIKMRNVDSHLGKPMILERCQWEKEYTGKMPVRKKTSLESDIHYVFSFWDTSV